MPNPTGTPKQPIRWDWIESQWQRGSISNVQIAKLHAEEFGTTVAESAIRKRVSQYGWQRDVSEAIRRATRAKLAKPEVRESASVAIRTQGIALTRTDELQEEIEAEEGEIVERASDALVLIEKEQRGRLARLKLVSDRLLAYTEACLPLDDEGDPRMAYEPGELYSIASVLGKAVASHGKVIELERKVYGMDAPPPASPVSVSVFVASQLDRLYADSSDIIDGAIEAGEPS